MNMGVVGIVGAAQVYYGWKTQKLRGSLGSREAANAAWFDRLHPCAAGLARREKSPPAFEDLPRGCQCYGLLMFDFYGLNQLEIERRFRWKCDVAIAREPRATGTRRGADQSANRRTLAAAGQRPNDRSAGRSAADHGCGALAFPLPGHRRSRGLNFIVLTVDSDARQCQRKH